MSSRPSQVPIDTKIASVRLWQHIGECGLVSYVSAIAVGIVAVADLLPFSTVLGTGSLWVMPGGDLAENLTGHLAYQTGGWHWPLLLAPNLAWPHGTSVAMTDSNPLVSLLAKALATVRGASANLLGFWIASCWLLQPLAAVYVLRGFGCRSWMANLSGAIFAVSFPALLFRVGHVNLCGHFLLLFALGLASRMLSAAVPLPRRYWIWVFVLLSVAILSHPYLYVFAAAVLAAPILRTALDPRLRAFSPVAWYLGSVSAPIVLYWVLSGTLGGGGRGFGYWSMNLLSPFWPQRSGVFGANLPVIDATGGQEFNYLGAGGLMLLAIAVIVQIRFGTLNWPHWRALVLILVLLTLLALSTKVYFGNTLVVSLGIKPWDQVFGTIQASGRAFWVVGYALLFASIAIISRRLSRGWLCVVLATAVVLQLIDTGPLRAAAQAYFSGRDERTPPIPILPQARWLSLLPICLHPGEAAEAADKLRLEAIRAGMWLRDMRMSRFPHWFNCEKALTDGTELPLLPREMRVFLAPPAINLFQQAALGADTNCRTLDGVILCTRDLPLDVGAPVAPGPSLPAVEVPTAALTGFALSPLLAYGWHPDSGGLPWSEGPRATLLFRVTSPTSRPLLLRLQLDGIARTVGGVRPISIRVGLGAPVDVNLRDFRSVTVDLPIPPTSITDGIMRIAIDIDHPADPGKRGLQAPVNRAGVRLHSIELE